MMPPFKYPSTPEYVYATVEADLYVEEPSGSKHVHVENIVKIKIKLSLTKVYIVGLHYMITLQCTKHKKKT